MPLPDLNQSLHNMWEVSILVHLQVALQILAAVDCRRNSTSNVKVSWIDGGCVPVTTTLLLTCCCCLTAVIDLLTLLLTCTDSISNADYCKDICRTFDSTCFCHDAWLQPTLQVRQSCVATNPPVPRLWFHQNIVWHRVRLWQVHALPEQKGVQLNVNVAKHNGGMCV